uniref:Rad51 domain-containing protein n=1 Tax=Heterorhabditis bacteriophora TaxID=37862 RepID=A0A1I7W8R8_HETBA
MFLKNTFVGKANIHKLFAIIQHLLAKLNTFFHVHLILTLTNPIRFRKVEEIELSQNIPYLNLRGVNLLDVEDSPLKLFLIYLK